MNVNLYAPKARVHSEDDYMELLSQFQVLQTKLSTKTETVLRLAKDLEQIEHSRKTWQATAENYERNLARAEHELQNLTTGASTSQQNSVRQVDDLKHEIWKMKAEKETLSRENLDLRAEIRDLQKDCKTFRQQLARVEVERMDTPTNGAPAPRTTTRVSSEQSTSDNYIEKYEKVVTENRQIKLDLNTLLSTKEELLLEREALVKKIERLSSELTYLLNGDPRQVVEDLDGLVAENRYLKAQLDNAQEESQTIKATLQKYQTVAEQAQAKKSSGSKQNDASLEEKTSVAVVNMKQIRELLASNAVELTEGDYRALSNVLLDLCNDKQMALAHQRRANKILGSRLHEVEQRLQTLEATRSPRSISPRNPDTQNGLAP